MARAAARRLRIPPRIRWPYALPGAAELHRRRWQLRLRRTPVLTLEQYGAQVEVGEIEELIGCDLCGETRVQPLFERHDPKRGRWSYRVVRCPSCGFLYRNPGVRPERLGDLYAGRYSKFLTGRYSKKRQRRYRLVMDAFAPLFEDGSGRRLLDFGCGTGLFLDLAHERGFDCYGVDLSEDSIEKARQRPSGQNAYFGAPDEIPEIAAGGFDVITLWSVLAHLATPIEDFKMLRGLLAPGGVVMILTVNANSLELKATQENWGGFTKNHLKFFSPTTLPRLLAQTGFEAVVMRPTPGDSIESGKTELSPAQLRRLYRNVHAGGNQSNMLRAVACADAGTPARWGLQNDALVL